ncbi:MAG: hypothetical protein HN485_11580 [Rhodospirillaceae bacterium]|nr:hypothetical protein [Rhodospirillaceae bacterium]
MSITPFNIPMSLSVIEPLDLNGPFDVADQLSEMIRSVEQGRGSDDDHLTVIRDVYARLKETRSRAILWVSGADYCSSMNPDTFIDLAVTELFGLTDHIPIGPDGLLLDVLYEAREPWFLGFDTWNLKSVQDALEMLCEARDKITCEQENTPI